MQVKIYGRPDCPFCVKAKDLSDYCTVNVKNFSYEYFNIRELGLTVENLSEMAGKEVKTVPQIWVDDVHIGGFTDFDGYLKNLMARNPELFV